MFGALVSDIGGKETCLPDALLEGARGRTTSPLRIFTNDIEYCNYPEKSHDILLLNRALLPSPDLRLVQRPVGPAAVLGCLNFH